MSPIGDCLWCRATGFADFPVREVRGKLEAEQFESQRPKLVVPVRGIRLGDQRPETCRKVGKFSCHAVFVSFVRLVFRHSLGVKANDWRMVRK